jgi:predicted amidohydrolase
MPNPTSRDDIPSRVKRMLDVASNQAASLKNYPPFSWPGGSMIVDFDGRVLAQATPGPGEQIVVRPGEQIVVGPIDLAALRAERQRRRGYQMLAHRKLDLR